MDISIRKNEHCIIGLPRCDFVFSSTRTCFIAYGFQTSPLEMTLIKNLLQSKGMQCEEAGGHLSPGQHAFCQKICSKIITSQFCIVLLNNDEKNNQLVPNANVNMEYGLMLGFNKYVIPFQLENHPLPFNVAGLDTVKYNKSNFNDKAASSINLAIEQTNQGVNSEAKIDQMVELFLVYKKALFVHIDDDGNKNIYRMGAPLGFNLLHDFSGLVYIFLGNFMALRPDIILWRLKMLNEILTERMESLEKRVKTGLVTPEQKIITENLFKELMIWILVTSNDDKLIISNALSKIEINYKFEIYSRSDIQLELDTLIKNNL